MAISEEEWNALPEEEKQRRREEFEAALRGLLEPFDRETVKAALKSVLADLKREAK